MKVIFTTSVLGITLLASEAFAQCGDMHCTPVPPNIQRELDRRLGTASVAVFGSASTCKPIGPTGNFCIQSTAYVGINSETNSAAFFCEAHAVGVAANVGIACGPDGTTAADGGGPQVAQGEAIIAADKENLVVTYSGITAGGSIPDTSYQLTWKYKP